MTNYQSCPRRWGSPPMPIRRRGSCTQGCLTLARHISIVITTTGNGPVTWMPPALGGVPRVSPTASIPTVRAAEGGPTGSRSPLSDNPQCRFPNPALGSTLANGSVPFVSSACSPSARCGYSPRSRAGATGPAASHPVISSCRPSRTLFRCSRPRCRSLPTASEINRDTPPLAESPWPPASPVQCHNLFPGDPALHQLLHPGRRGLRAAEGGHHDPVELLGQQRVQATDG